jgi:hypothetical protein
MKQSFLLLITICIFTACNNKNQSAGSAAGSSDSANTTAGDSRVQKKVEELQQLTPYTPEQLKAMIPVMLSDDSASEVSAYTNMGTAYAGTIYRHDDYMNIELDVFDCAGSAGAGLYSRHYQEVENITDKHTKITDFNGEKAIEHLDDGDSRHPVFTFIANGRLLVTLEGENFDMETLKEKARKLSLKP